MSDFPNKIDDDTTLPAANDNLTEDRAENINALRDAVFNIETEIGSGPDGYSRASGTAGSIASRLATSLNPDGTIRASALTSLGLVTLPVTNLQIADHAGIPESKLLLDYKTQDLFNFTSDLARSVNTALDWIALSGVKLEPHLIGLIYRHTLDQIDVSSNPTLYLKNRFGLLRDNSQSYNVLADLNHDFVAHQLTDGTLPGSSPTVTTSGGSTYPSAYGHTASGIYLDSSIFSIVPHTVVDLQSFAEFVDSANTLLLGTKIETLYNNGISRSARSTRLGNNSEGIQLVPPTQATTYLLNGNVTSPVDDIFTGDDIIIFTPDVTSTAYTTFQFDAQFNAIKPGDVVNINYGPVSTSFLVKEIKYNPNITSPRRVFAIRVAGKNLVATTNATVDVSRSLVNTNKYGVLAPAVAVLTDSSSNVISVGSGLPSLIIGAPRGAQALGIGFDADLLDSSHYNLYLQLYPTGNPVDKVVNLVAIDVTGNAGATPGTYTLDSIVQNVNNVFRRPGFNYRFIAFEYQGEFGIMLADSYGGAAFSITSGVVDGYGNPNPSLSTTIYPNNVIDVSNNIDPLGFVAANVASPPFSTSFSFPQGAEVATKVISPLQRNFYYVNGGESDRFALEPGQLLDGNGDAYWPASITAKVLSGPRVQATYTVNDNLSTSRLQVGKTLVVQPQNNDGLYTDFGRFIIQNIVFNSTCGSDGYTFSTDITVYDAVHGTGVSPFLTSPVGTAVKLYFNSDSVGFNAENASDDNTVGKPFKRSFEIYINQDGYTFSYERARANYFGAEFSINGVPFFGSNELKFANIVDVSPKLRGYSFSGVTKINLQINSYTPATGSFTGYLRELASDEVTETHLGPLTTGKQGQVTRFYDETNIDYIDVLFDINDVIPTITNKHVDIQLFPSLILDEELFLLAKCQANDSTKEIKYLRDRRQFGNTSEKQLSDSALDFIQAGDKYLHQNGVIRGFDLIGVSNGTISLNGGLALVNGRMNNVNEDFITIPTSRELLNSDGYNVNWLLCVGPTGQFVTLPLTDFDPTLAGGPPAVGDRVITLRNEASGVSATVDSVTFKSLLNVRKDLTPLYLAAATISGTGISAAISLAVQDIRKYAVDATSILNATLTNQITEGNFRNLSAATTWLRFDPTYENTLDVKSVFVSAIDPNLSGIHVNGKGAGAGLNISVVTTVASAFFNNLAFTVGSSFTDTGSQFNNVVMAVTGPLSLTNTTLTNSSLTVSNATTIAGATLSGMTSSTVFPVSFTSIISGSTFNNWQGHITFGGPATISNTTFTNISGLSSFQNASTTLTNVTFTNCNFTFLQGATFNNVTFNNCTLDFRAGTFAAAGLTMVNCNITHEVSFPAGSNITILDSQVVVTSTNMLVLSDNYRFERTTFVWSPPSPIGDGYYSTTNWINAPNGMLHVSLGLNGTLSNLIVRDCFFNVSASDHYGFFSFQFTDTSAYVQDIDIRGNQFISHNGADDIRAVIAFTSMLAVTVSAQPTTNAVKNPTMFNVNISDNICNYDQMIAIAGTRFFIGAGFNSISGPLLDTINCKINNNICGIISFITAAAGPFNGSNSSLTNPAPNRNKTDRLTISGNTCKLITNLDSLGQYIGFRLTLPDGGPGSYSHRDLTNVGTGSCLIANNTANWIQVGVSAYGTNTNALSTVTMQNYDGITIVDNLLSPANPTFLNSFNDTVNSGAPTPTMGNYAITLRREFNRTGNTQSVISGNRIMQKPTQNSNGTVTTYLYDQAIVCLNSATITDNVVNGVLNSSSSSILVLWGSGNVVATGNIFERGPVADQTGLTPPNTGNTIQSYVWCASGLGAGNLVRITNNIFDSQWVDQANTIEQPGLTIPVTWAFSNNKNQVAYAAVELISNQHGYWDEGPFTFVYEDPYPASSGSHGKGALQVYKSPFLPGYPSILPSQNTTVYIGLSGLANQTIGWATTIDLSSEIPLNVQILGAKLGASAFHFGTLLTTSGSAGDFNEITMNIMSCPIVTANFNTGTGSILDTKVSSAFTNISGGIIGLNSANIASLESASQYLSASGFGQQFITNETVDIIAEIHLVLEPSNAGSGNVGLVLSPLVIKYIW